MATNLPTSRRVLRLPRVMDKTGLGRDSIYRLVREGRFPKQIKLSTKAAGWFEDEVDGFLAKCAATRDGASA